MGATTTKAALCSSGVNVNNALTDTNRAIPVNAIGRVSYPHFKRS